MVKKLFLIFIILNFLFILAGCGNDQYSVEREYWYLQKRAKKVLLNPEASPTMQVNRIVDALNSFAKIHPDSTLVVSAEFSIANLYIVKKEFSQGRAQLQHMITKYKDSDNICAEAYLMIGKSYELQDKWPSALEQYRKIMRDYTETTRGLEIPIYIAQHYKTKYEPDKMIAALQEAISHYKAIAAKHPITPLSLNMDMLVAQCYSEIKDWQGAIDTLNSILTSYNGKVSFEEILLSLAGIYSQKLNNPAKAIEILEVLLKEYPKSKYVNSAKEMIKRLSEKPVK